MVCFDVFSWIASDFFPDLLLERLRCVLAWKQMATSEQEEEGKIDDDIHDNNILMWKHYMVLITAIWRELWKFYIVKNRMSKQKPNGNLSKKTRQSCASLQTFEFMCAQ